MDLNEAKAEKRILPFNEASSVKKVFAVVSAKGGVGKSLLTVLLSVLMRRAGYTVGILDADLTGPSVPRAFGIHGHAERDGFGLFPAKSKTGIRVMSLNLLLEHETDPAIFRGSLLAGTVGQLYSQTVFGDLDCLFIDCPPGTGDIPLTVLSSLPVDGVIAVTAPSQLVGMIAEKSVKMAQQCKIPVLALAENMSEIRCDSCGHRFSVFGESRVAETADKYGIPVTAKIPFDPKLAAAFDRGMIELFEGDYLDAVASELSEILSSASTESV